VTRSVRAGTSEVEHILITGDDPAGSLAQNTQFSIGMRRTDVFDQFVTALGPAHHLHRDRTRGGPHFAHEYPPVPTRLVSPSMRRHDVGSGRSDGARAHCCP
jgi:hypothetical protein